MWIGNQRLGSLTRDDLLELGRLLIKAGYAVQQRREKKGKGTAYVYGIKATGDKQREKPCSLALEDIQIKYDLGYERLILLLQEIGSLTEYGSEMFKIITRLDEIDSEEY